MTVTYAEAKAHLRLDSDDEQTVVEAMIAAAEDYAENAMACTLTSRTRTASYSDLSDVVLRYGPVIDIDSVTDADGRSVTYDEMPVGRTVRLVLTSPATAPVTVAYTAGYEDTADVPASVRLAILSHVAAMFENREAISDKPLQPVPLGLQEFYKLLSRKTGGN